MRDEITIGFDYTGECGDSYSATSTLASFPDIGESNIDVIGRQLNCFLRQVGYYRPNDNILMESLSDDEYDAVVEFLENYRSDKMRDELQVPGQMGIFDILKEDGANED